MLRIIAFSREKDTVPKDVMKFTTYSDVDDAFITPPIEVLKQMRIVVITLSSGGKLPNLGLQNHFSHVFMDEAGHAIEPEAIGVFSIQAQKDAVIVLAGQYNFF